MNLFYVDNMMVWRDGNAPEKNLQGMYLNRFTRFVAVLRGALKCIPDRATWPTLETANSDTMRADSDT
jgi:hypothetical protein